MIQLPTMTFFVQNPQQFILELLKFIQEETQNDMTAERVQQVTYALTALANVIIKNPGKLYLVCTVLDKKVIIIENTVNIG